MARSRVILVAGPAGCRVYEKLEQVVEIAKKEGAEVRLERTFDTMREVAGERHGIDVTETNILNLLPERLRSIRKDALREIKDRIDSEPGIYVIRSPGTFSWGGTLISGLDYDDVDLLGPETFLVVIDDVLIVKVNLAEDPEWMTQRFSLRDLAAWREQEIMLIEDQARRLRARFYVVARAHPTGVFADLILHPNKPRIYLSYPITHMPETMREEFGRKREEFIEALSRMGYIVFDPITIREGVILSELESCEQKIRAAGKQPDPSEEIEFELEFDGRRKAFKYPYSELADVSDLIEGQIVKRDFAMIEASDMVLVYNPLGLGSPGVACEMLYGHRILGKTVYLIWGGEGRPSPFYTAFCHKRFSSKEESLSHLRR